MKVLKLFLLLLDCVTALTFTFSKLIDKTSRQTHYTEIKIHSPGMCCQVISIIGKLSREPNITELWTNVFKDQISIPVMGYDIVISNFSL